MSGTNGYPTNGAPEPHDSPLGQSRAIARANADRLLRGVQQEVTGAKVPGLTRIDSHCHSWASSGPALKALGLIGMPECYSPPEKVYDQAMARGMDLVTITDHDTIKGAMELVERGFDRFIVGQEVSVKFPEDRCLLHVLVWGLTPELDEQITKLDLRDDVYEFAAWLKEHNLPHAVAHPLYIQNGKLTRWHIERVALLFKGIECLNGAHAYQVSDSIVRFINDLTPARIDALAERHNLEPLWDRPWEKMRSGGSDDHGLLNIGRTLHPGRRPPTARRSATRASSSALVMKATARRRAWAGTRPCSPTSSRRWGRTTTPTGCTSGRRRRRSTWARLLRFAGVERAVPQQETRRGVQDVPQGLARQEGPQAAADPPASQEVDDARSSTATRGSSSASTPTRGRAVPPSASTRRWRTSSRTSPPRSARR
jgi:hypothetical protein